MKNFKNKLLLLNLILIILAFLYFLFFIRRGINLGDEGYYIFYAEKIAHGEIPYKDFALQYTPGYFYLLGFIYKLFGSGIIAGRALSMVFSLLVLASSFFLLRKYKIKSLKIHALVGLTLISLGYPLLYIPLTVWPCVLLAVLIQITFLAWNRKQIIKNLLILGLLLALTAFFKQNIGLVFFAIVNFLVFSFSKPGLKNKIESIFFLNLSFVFFTLLWIYFSFIRVDNAIGIIQLIQYGGGLYKSVPLSYPSPLMILEPTGFFKLLPYYSPIFYGLFVLFDLLKRKIDPEKVSFAAISLGGFFIALFPAGDLIHLYPFLGLAIFSSIIYFRKHKRFYLIKILTVIFILLGIYLTFFGKSFRYDDYFLKENTPLPLPTTKGILYDPNYTPNAALIPLYNFISSHTKKGDYIFVYPFAPTLYHILDRQSPSGVIQFIILEAPHYPETRVLAEIKQKRVKYIIRIQDDGQKGPLLNFIKQQKHLEKIGIFNIYEVTK